MTNIPYYDGSPPPLITDISPALLRACTAFPPEAADQLGRAVSEARSADLGSSKMAASTRETANEEFSAGCKAEQGCGRYGSIKSDNDHLNSAQLRTTQHPSLIFPQAQHICMVMADGLGYNMIASRWGHVKFLRAMLQPCVSTENAYVHTCLPSSTACAIPALTTGCLPAQTGMLGYETKPGIDMPVVNLLQFRQRNHREYPAKSFYRKPTLFDVAINSGRRAVAVGPHKFRASGMSYVSLHGAEIVTEKRLMNRCEKGVEALRAGADISYIYWDGIDHAGHNYGWQSYEWLCELEAFDAAMDWLASHLPPRTLLLVVADHGMVDVDLSQQTSICDYPTLVQDVADIAGEPRALHVHLHHDVGDGEDVMNERIELAARRWQDLLGERALVIPRMQAQAFYGKVEDPQIYLPDLTVFSLDKASIVDKRIHSPKACGLKGMHGSVTEDELLIPVGVLLT
ncbi:MAG: alkaline phosphatase family protein [Actinomycetaceae bacterium]|nr:alkaline phosphatase family protein [Actinomycetaceae bacterium]